MSPEPVFAGRLAIQQRVLPNYRAPFFDLLAASCAGGLCVFAGLPQIEEQISTAKDLTAAKLYLARNHHLFNVSSALYHCWQSGILDWLEICNPDALIVEANPRYLTTSRAISWMHSRLRPVLGWGLGAPAISGRLAGFRRRSRRNFLRRLDGLIAYSGKGAQEYQSIGIHPERIFVASNASAPIPKNPPPIRPEYFQNRPRLLFVGRLQPRKQIDKLLQACADLPAEMQPCLQIVGDGPARSSLEDLAAKIYPNAEFHGAVFGHGLERFFLEADLFVLPGTGGLAVQQAMSYGLPVIVAQGDGTQGDLVRPENGWVIAPDDLSALTRALHSALSDVHRLRRMGKNSYQIVATEINLEAMVASFVSALNEICKMPLISPATDKHNHREAWLK